MFGFFSKEKKEKEEIEEVKKWFLPLTVTDGTGKVKSHLLSLVKYGNNKVKSGDKSNSSGWSRMFAECMNDIGLSDSQIIDKYRTKFIKECIDEFKINMVESKQIEEQVYNKLDSINKKEFVFLFAKIINKLVKADAEAQANADAEAQAKAHAEAQAKAKADAEDPATFKDEEEDENGCIKGKEVFYSYTNKCINIPPNGIPDGGSKKKSHKRATRHSRRTRRSRGSRRNDSRKYKKYNKR